MDEFYSEVYARVKERIGSMNLSPDAQQEKRAKYFTLFSKEPVRLSALAIHNIATDLMTTFNWVLTGEHEPLELRTTVRNIVNNGDGTGGNADWVMAEEVLRDAEMAYRQASFRDRFESFARLQEAGGVGEAMQKLHSIVETNPHAAFFDVIEESFGVEVILLKSDRAFDAIGAVSGNMAFIVANSKHGVSRIFYAVACELAMIATGKLALYSDVFEEDFPSDPAVGEFMEQLMRAFDFERAVAEYAAVERRFPKGLVEAHRDAVAKHGNLGFFLEWMTGEPTRNVLPHIDADHLIDLMD